MNRVFSLERICAPPVRRKAVASAALTCIAVSPEATRIVRDAGRNSGRASCAIRSKTTAAGLSREVTTALAAQLAGVDCTSAEKSHSPRRTGKLARFGPDGFEVFQHGAKVRRGIVITTPDWRHFKGFSFGGVNTTSVRKQKIDRHVEDPCKLAACVARLASVLDQRQIALPEFPLPWRHRPVSGRAAQPPRADGRHRPTPGSRPVATNTAPGLPSRSNSALAAASIWSLQLSKSSSRWRSPSSPQSAVMVSLLTRQGMISPELGSRIPKFTEPSSPSKNAPTLYLSSGTLAVLAGQPTLCNPR